MTHGAIRQASYWLVNGNQVVSKETNSCVTCKRLCGRPLEQEMADLPTDRMEETAPFTYVGFDIFGPWSIHSRKTRGAAATSKRWGLLFACLNSRAVHIEILESMDSNSFICTLRHFFALSGPVSLLRCDCGTNFMGGKSELDNALNLLDDAKLEWFTKEQNCEWHSNPPHASHFGGVWERQIGTIHHMLDGMMMELGRSQLMHELLVTLMAEVSAIENAGPLATVPSDTEEQKPLSPAMLLCMKTRPVAPAPGVFVPADLYLCRHWRRVQYLADQFWVRWRCEYLHLLQPRQKWSSPQPNLNVGDVVLVKEVDTYRNDWPLGRIREPIRNDDGSQGRLKGRIKLLRSNQGTN